MCTSTGRTSLAQLASFMLDGCSPSQCVTHGFLTKEASALLDQCMKVQPELPALQQRLAVLLWGNSKLAIDLREYDWLTEQLAFQPEPVEPEPQTEDKPVAAVAVQPPLPTSAPKPTPKPAPKPAAPGIGAAAGPAAPSAVASPAPKVAPAKREQSPADKAASPKVTPLKKNLAEPDDSDEPLDGTPQKEAADSFCRTLSPGDSATSTPPSQSTDWAGRMQTDSSFHSTTSMPSARLKEVNLKVNSLFHKTDVESEGSDVSD
eukprot:NODE_1003_length_1948_cov_77.625205_g952_i0.p3 GENE.NODE_1003_length_1948_cov_77.625205_g952_i0~~NODE_1003_length_1948_cov_77.625205_g952_i0.p3  ORF type:complete len:262 (+),score=53.67 NODE_1003_length_1948_cov_77.625205_g952_i0:1014-1799(+)